MVVCKRFGGEIIGITPQNDTDVRDQSTPPISLHHTTMLKNYTTPMKEVGPSAADRSLVFPFDVAVIPPVHIPGGLSAVGDEKIPKNSFKNYPPQ